MEHGEREDRCERNGDRTRQMEKKSARHIRTAKSAIGGGLSQSPLKTPDFYSSYFRKLTGLL